MLTGKTWAEAAEILKERYERSYKRITQLTPDDVFETYMNAVAHNMDPHSSYLSPRQSEEYRIQMSLSYDGIGASLQLEDDYVKVMNIIPGGPAQIDGQLKPEDRITAVGEGQGELVDVIGWRLDDVVQQDSRPRRHARPPAGAAGRRRSGLAGKNHRADARQDQARRAGGEEASCSRFRSTAELPIGVITVPSFYQDFAARSRGDEDYTSTSRDVTRLIEEFKAEGGVDGIVMDLRANGGGHLSEATELSGLFIERGPVVQLRETRGTIQQLDDPSPSGRLRRPARRARRSLQRERVGDLRRRDPRLRPRRDHRPANVRQRLRAEPVPARPPDARHGQRPAHAHDRQVLPRHRREHAASRRDPRHRAAVDGRHRDRRREHARHGAAVGSDPADALPRRPGARRGARRRCARTSRRARRTTRSSAIC